MTDLNGRFEIKGLDTGEYTLLATAEYYKSSRVEEVVIVSGESVRVDVPLYGDSSDIIELDEVSVKAEVLRNSEIGLLGRRQMSAAFSDSIGSESFEKLGLSDASDAMTKVAGASIVDGKYVVVRGLSDRYNNTSLNGAQVPSSDPNRKAVQLDQFPSGLIDVVSTTKTFTPDRSGEFTGGSVDIETKAFPSRPFLTASVGLGYNDVTTGKAFLASTGGSDDWLGRDDGTRQLPELARDSFNLNPGADRDVRDELIRSFSPEMVPTRVSAPYNKSWSVAFGNTQDFLGMPFGYVGSVTYNREFSSNPSLREVRYRPRDPDRDGIYDFDATKDFTGLKSTDSVNLGALLNLSLKPSENHEVGVRNFYSQSSIDESLDQAGTFFESDSSYVRESRIHFVERSIASTKLYGEHVLPQMGDLRLEWDYAMTRSSQDEPDYRLFYDRVDLYAYENLPESEWNWTFPVGLERRRVFRELSEDNDEVGLDLSLPIRIGDLRSSFVKMGYRAVDSERSYDSLAIGIAGAAPTRYEGEREAFLAPGNVGLIDGRMRRAAIDLTDIIPSYRGERKIEAYYGMADVALTKRLRLIAGGRKEKTDIQVDAESFILPSLSAHARIEDEHWLPSASAIWGVGEGQNLRFAYSKTLARPNFRELAPVSFEDSVGGENIVGNSELAMTRIENWDLRWEFFGEQGNMAAVSLFRKNLENAIEQTVDIGRRITWANVPTGQVTGLELEGRRQLEFLSGEFHAVTLVGNLSFIQSEVDRAEQEISAKSNFLPDLDPVRSLQGQSELLGNLDISYQHFRRGTSVALSTNYTGERLYRVSLAHPSDIFEAPRLTLNLNLSQSLSERWVARLKIGNILNEESEYSYSYLGNSYVYSQGETGRTYSLGLSYSFQ